jgi:hypothetical protein
MNMAYIAIVDYILAFAVAHIMENPDSDYPRTYGGTTGFMHSRPEYMPEPGDLVRLDSMRDPEFRLCWLIAVTLDNKNGFHVYTVESVKTGAICDWSNVGISIFHRKTKDNHPEWRWTDIQFSFRDLWFAACSEQSDHVHVPTYPTFEDGKVILELRRRFSLQDEPRISLVVENYEVLTQDQLEDIYLDMIKKDA